MLQPLSQEDTEIIFPQELQMAIVGINFPIVNFTFDAKEGAYIESDILIHYLSIRYM